MTNVRRRGCIFQDITAESSVGGASCFVSFYSAARLREPRARLEKFTPSSPRGWTFMEGYWAIHACEKNRRTQLLYFIFFVTLKFLIYSLNKANNCYNTAIISDLLVLRNTSDFAL